MKPKSVPKNSKKNIKKQNEVDKKQIMEFYKARKDEIDQQRFNWLKNIDDINSSINEFHLKELELRDITNKIIEYQQILTESNIALNNERKKIINFKNELDNFRIKTKNDRRRMLELLKQDNEFENEVQRNQIVEKRKLDISNLVLEENTYLENLRNSLKYMYDNLLIKQKENDKRRDEEIRLHLNNMNSHINSLENRKKGLEFYNNTLNSYYLDNQFNSDSNNKILINELEKNKTENSALKKSLADFRKKSQIDAEKTQKEYNKQSKIMASTLRKQIQNKKETKILAQKQYDRIKQMYDDKISQIQEKYNLLKEGIFGDDEGGEEENEEIDSEEENKYREIRNNMEKYRTELRNFEDFINSLKTKTRGDYDNYYEINYTTQKINDEFLTKTKIIDNELSEFLMVLKPLYRKQKNKIEGFKDGYENFEKNIKKINFGDIRIKNEENKQDDFTNNYQIMGEDNMENNGQNEEQNEGDGEVINEGEEKFN